tara:strand:- start:963 stop:1529 length:567 start_codon:yes stop_codon:yes gene_type:complete
MNYVFQIIELNKFTNNLRILYKNYLKKWVEYGGNPLTALHASNISTNEKVISDISKTFKEDIIENFKFFKVLANGEAMPHTDNRNVAINIPIIVDIRNTLSFYEDTGKSEDSKLFIDGKKVKTKARSYPKTNIIETINTLNSFCLNTKAIHGITTNCNSDRIILSISMKDKYNDYDKLKQMYDGGNLI